jgi:hypothetical protein
MNVWNRMTGIQALTWGVPVGLVALTMVVLGVAVFSFLIYKRQRGVPGIVRRSLAIARFLVLVLTVFTLFDPMAVVRRVRTVKRRLPILIDVSESMSIKDQRKRPEDVVAAAMALGIVPNSWTGDVNRVAMRLGSKAREAISDASRIDLVASLLSTSARPVLAKLSEKVEIDYYVFGTQLQMLASGNSMPSNTLVKLVADEAGTSIADALESVASSGRDAPLAGIVLLSDGLDTASHQADSILQYLGIQNIPVFPVPMGLPDPDDVSIRNVVMQDVAFSGDKVPVRVQIRSKGYEKRSATMTVSLNQRKVAQRQIRLTGGLQFEDIFFNVDVHEKGAARVSITVEPFQDEATALNNSVVRSVRIVNEKINVLCIEGSPRWEYRYLRAMLKRDPRINATFIATRTGPEMARNASEYIARFPERRDEAFQYDLVILGDVNAEFFTGDEFLRLEELVRERGGSLLMLCGAHYAPTSYAGTPVENMLPVAFEPETEWRQIDDNVYPVLTPEGQSSLVMTLEMDPEDNDRVWSRVAPLNHVPPLLEIRPGATVLATLSDAVSRVDSYPLVSWQRYGTGKCMMIGTDRMWLLRFKTGDKYHWRVWSQCIQFLTLSRLMGEHKRIRIETDRASYPVDGQVQIHAQLLDDRYEPIMQAGFDVRVIPLDVAGAEAQSVTLRPDAQSPGMFGGFFSPTHSGRYRIEANAADQPISNSTEFQASDVQPEMTTTDVQMGELERIASVSGGRCLGMTDLNKLETLLTLEPYTERYTVEIRLWDNGWVLLLLVCLMGGEWIVRRRYDLA